jgi:hypothetical protein
MSEEEKKIKSFKEVHKAIQESNATFKEKMGKSGGSGAYFRALVAQVLWLTFLYLFAKEIVPVKDVLVSNAIIVVLLTVYSFLWTIIKKKIPSWIDEVIRGELFYKFDIILINYCIAILSAFVIILLGMRYI